MSKPHAPEWRKDQIPSELIELRKEIEQLPLHVRQKLLPMCERLYHYSRLHSRLLRIAQEAVDQLQLDSKYMQFDLEATRRERDDLLREIRGFDEDAH
jgi:cell division protein FtsB